MSAQHTLVWTDVPVLDLDRAMNFYSAVLGQPVAKQTHGNYSFGLLPHAQDQVSGCLAVMEDNKPCEFGPLVYFNVGQRMDEAIAEVAKHGGKIVKEKHQIGPYGFRAVVIDSEGNKIALHSEAK